MTEPLKQHVYVMQCGPYHKIGVTIGDPRQRLKTIQCDCPYPVYLRGYMVATREDERWFHILFQERWVQGEWFHLTETQLRSLKRTCLRRQGEWFNLGRPPQTFEVRTRPPRKTTAGMTRRREEARDKFERLNIQVREKLHAIGGREMTESERAAVRRKADDLYGIPRRSDN